MRTSDLTRRTHPALRPAVGMGATLHLFSDRESYTVTEVSTTGKTFRMRRDKTHWVHLNGKPVLAAQPDPNGREETVRLRVDGIWRTGGLPPLVVTLGHRDEHRDPAFVMPPSEA